MIVNWPFVILALVILVVLIARGDDNPPTSKA